MYIMFGRGIYEKYQLRDKNFPRAERQGKFSLKIGVFRKYPSQYNISVLINNTFYLSFSGIFCFYCLFQERFNLL
jgi:hypothetical protein